MSSPNPEDTAAAEAALSALELAELQALVGQDLKALLATEDTNEEINYAKVLERLTSTDAMAKGVEAKLDNILENLDSLLESLGVPGEDSTEAPSAGASGSSTTTTDPTTRPTSKET